MCRYIIKEVLVGGFRLISETGTNVILQILEGLEDQTGNGADTGVTINQYAFSVFPEVMHFQKAIVRDRETVGSIICSKQTCSLAVDVTARRSEGAMGEVR